ncbi:MAG TPA: immunoglobulin domain-containing protein, partial [Clostridia bacterium]|nr:immunoglobulin domain-containing protein [Clostridia bacterium]
MNSTIVSNALGSVTSVVVALDVVDPMISNQPTNQAVNLGQNTLISATASGTPPLTYQWLKDGVNLPGGTDCVLALTNVQTTDAGTYSLLVSNTFGSAVSLAAMLSVNAVTVSPFIATTNIKVQSLAMQTDGKILACGQPPGTGLSFVWRLNADGTLDTALDSASTNVSVWCLAVQPDGKILVSGSRSLPGGYSRDDIWRLNVDGTLDPTFNPVVDNSVCGLVIQPDGKIVLGGWFTKLCGQPRKGIGRLNPDGSLDQSFNPEAGGSVESLAVQRDGKLVLAGW